MTPEREAFLAEYEAVCKKHKMYITGNMYHEMEIFDCTDDDMLMRDFEDDIRLHCEGIRELS